MKINLKTVLIGFSLMLNGLFIAVLIIGAMSDNKSVFFPAPRDGYLAAAAVAHFPASSALVFSPVEFSLKPGDKVYLQYSVISQKQNNVLINALYDPDIISVRQTGSGIEINALRGGETLMQAFTSGGIKDVALITVTE
jgi:hypothetical protein